jgi:hypothetical protein
VERLPGQSEDGRSAVAGVEVVERCGVGAVESGGEDLRIASVVVGIDGRAPDWFPNGTEIVYVDRKGEVYTALADGADQQELPAYHNCVAQKICSNGADFAVFSPDGQEVAFDGAGRFHRC